MAPRLTKTDLARVIVAARDNLAALPPPRDPRVSRMVKQDLPLLRELHRIALQIQAARNTRGRPTS